MGKKGGRTPNQLLHDYAFHGDLRAGMLWKEYALAFKGKKHLVPADFSALLGEAEALPDGVVAESQDKDSLLLVHLTWAQWKIVLQHEMVGEVKEVADRGDFDLLADFLRPMGIVLEPLW